MAETKAKRLLPLLFVLILSTATASDVNSTVFIQKSCGRTLYPNLCCSSLVPYESTVQQSSCNLAVVAANVSLAKIRDVQSLALALRRGRGGRLGAALRDCFKLLSTAADLTMQATAEMRKVGDTTKSSEMNWHVSNAQTWMSGAMTQEETCLDGFEGVKGGLGKKAMCDRVGGVKQYSSNALALLNVLAQGD